MDADTLPALRRGLRILHLAAQRPGGIGFADLVRILGVGGASLSRLLKVLVDEGMLRCDEASGRYRSGPGFEAMVAAVSGLGALPALAQPVLARLADGAGASAVLVVAVEPDFVIGAKSEVAGGCVHVPVGARMPEPLRNGLGQCLAAHLGEAARAALLAAWGPAPGVPGAWEAALAAIRGGLAVVPDWPDLGHFVRVAWPVFRADGAAAGVLGLSLPVHQAARAEALAEAVRAAAQGLTSRLAVPG